MAGPHFKPIRPPIATLGQNPTDIRLQNLEADQFHQAQNFGQLSSKVDQLAQSLDKLNTTLPFFIKELTDLVSDFKDFKDRITETELDHIRHQHEKELEKVKTSTEVQAKTKLMWTGLGVVFTALIGLLIRIFIIRF